MNKRPRLNLSINIPINKNTISVDKNDITLEKLLNERISQPRVKEIILEINEKTKNPNPDDIEWIREKLTKCKLQGRGSRQFDIMHPITRQHPRFKSYVCNFSPTTILKIINCECSILSDFMMMKEIGFQQYANELASSCEFEAPVIMKYGKFQMNEIERLNSSDFSVFQYDCFWFFMMNKLPYNDLKTNLKYMDSINEYTCDAIVNKLNELRKCMEQKGLYHNDYHSENIFYDEKNKKIGLIDYGQAENYSSNALTDNSNFDCNKLRMIQEKQKQKQKLIETQGGKRETQGGKRKREKKKKTVKNLKL